MNEPPKIRRHYTRRWKAKKERWLAANPDGIAVRDLTKTGCIEGLYVFKMKYDWGKRPDGTPMTGELLAIAPYYEENGELRWRGRQRAASGGKLQVQYDLVSIPPTMGFKVADSILRLLGQEGLKEEAVEVDHAELERQAEQNRLDKLLHEVYGGKA